MNHPSEHDAHGSWQERAEHAERIISAQKAQLQKILYLADEWDQSGNRPRVRCARDLYRVLKGGAA